MLTKVKVLLGKQSSKVGIVYTLTDRKNEPAMNPYITHVTINDIQQLLRNHHYTEDTRHWFIVDPLGRMVLHYTAEQVPKQMLNDLNKLLKSSRQLNA